MGRARPSNSSRASIGARLLLASGAASACRPIDSTRVLRGPLGSAVVCPLVAALIALLGSAVVRSLCFVGIARLGNATVVPVCDWEVAWGSKNSDIAPVAAAL